MDNMNVDLASIIKGSAIGAAVGTLVVGLVKDWFGEFVGERFKIRWVHRTEKKELADQVVKICTEGEQCGWNIRPRSYEHMLFISNKLMGLNKGLAGKLQVYIGKWVLNAVMQEKMPASEGNVEFCVKLQKELGVLDSDIIAGVSKVEK